MGSSKTLKDHSRTLWTRPDDGPPGDTNLIIGCLQRIADALEIVSKSYSEILNDRDYYKRRSEEEMERSQKKERTIRAYKGVITKAKKKCHTSKKTTK